LPWTVEDRRTLDLAIIEQLPTLVTRLRQRKCLCGKSPKADLPDIDPKRWNPSIRAPHHDRDLYEWILAWLHGVRATVMRKRLSEAAAALRAQALAFNEGDPALGYELDRE
jgi:hypothetical protein